jgi:hypothetical protein
MCRHFVFLSHMQHSSGNLLRLNSCIQHRNRSVQPTCPDFPSDYQFWLMHKSACC